MKVVDRRIMLFKIRYVFFSEVPFSSKGCDVLIFRHCIFNKEVPNFIKQIGYTSIINLKNDLENIWKNMDKSSCRYAVKRAERDGVEVFIDKYYNEFYEIYKEFRKSKKLDKFNFLKLNEIKKYSTLMVAVYEGDILCGHIYLEDENNIMYWQSARKLNVDKQFTTLVGNASKLIHWEAIKYAKDRGIEKFDMGGLFPPEVAENDRIKEGINKYKLSFGGDVVRVYNYKRIYSKIYKLGSLIYNIWR